MNNTFDFNRFGQVLAHDWKVYFRNFGIRLIVFCTLPVLLWITTTVMDAPAGGSKRIPLFFAVVAGALMSVPNRAFGDANLPREGVGFAMLPATNTEKFFSQLLYCTLLTPVIVFLGQWAVDSLLTALPFGGFESYLPWRLFSGKVAIAFICMGLLLSSIFMFGNMVFQKRKAGKTIAWGMLILFIIVMVVQLFHGWEAFARWETNPDIQDKLAWLFDVVMLVGAIVFYYLTYHKIKNQKY